MENNENAEEIKPGFTSQNSFCVAPWIHHYRNPVGHTGLCCVSDRLDQDLREKTFEEIQNSSKLKSIRVQMMNGELPKECGACKFSNTNRVYKDDLNYDFKHLYQDIVDKTAPDGETSIEPAYLDFRFLDCNLTCRTCNPEFSSSWYNQIKRKDPDDYYLKNFNYDKSIAEFTKKEYNRLVKKYNWQRIYFAGGEPLLQKDHISILQTLSEKPTAGEMNIFYNTNLSFNQNYLGRVLDELKKFNRVEIFVSIDSFGKFNDMIRKGSKFSQIDSNLQFISTNKDVGTRIVVDLTITSVFFYNAIEFSEWILKHQYKLHARVMSGEGYAGSFFNMGMLKLEFRKKAYERWLKWLENQSENDQAILNNLKEVLASFYQGPEWELSEMVKHYLNLSLQTLDQEALHFIKYNMQQDLIHQEFVTKLIEEKRID